MVTKHIMQVMEFICTIVDTHTQHIRCMHAALPPLPHTLAFVSDELKSAKQLNTHACSALTILQLYTIRLILNIC